MDLPKAGVSYTCEGAGLQVLATLCVKGRGRVRGSCVGSEGGRDVYVHFSHACLVKVTTSG